MTIICAGIECAVIDGKTLLFRGTRHECDQLQLRVKMGFTVDQAIEYVESRRDAPGTPTWGDVGLELAFAVVFTAALVGWTLWKAAL